MERHGVNPIGNMVSYTIRNMLYDQSSGRTVVVAAIERQFAALFGLVDTLRPEAKEVVSELERMGLEVGRVYPPYRNPVCVFFNENT